MEDLYWGSQRVNAWIKDRHGTYVKCSEGYAAHAGIDSAKAIIGKCDHDLIWHDHADRIFKQDTMVMAGLAVTNSHTMLITSQGIKTILSNKQKEQNYLIGNAVDITGQVLMEQKGRWNIQTGHFEVNGIQLTAKEVDVVRLLLMANSSKIIAAKLDISPKTVEQRIENLRRKFNAGSKVALAQTLHLSGLSYLAMGKDKYLN
mgnify:CR=1 FL=1